jgi:hypothetical protein
MIIHNAFKLCQKTNKTGDQVLGYYYQYERLFATVPNSRKEKRDQRKTLSEANSLYNGEKWHIYFSNSFL